MTITDYLSRKSTKPIMTIRFQDQNIAGRIYGICTPKVTLYKYSISMKNEMLGRSYSLPIEQERYTSKEVVETYKKKGWKWDFIHPYNGYEIDCLTKEEPFKELPKGENLVGYVYGKILKGRSEIESYLQDNFRGFYPVTIYRVPTNVEL